VPHGVFGAHIQRRTQQGKTRRQTTRWLKRHLARNLYRLLEHPRRRPLDKHRSIWRRRTSRKRTKQGVSGATEPDVTRVTCADARRAIAVTPANTA
jgi:hypothetical protein